MATAAFAMAFALAGADPSWGVLAVTGEGVWAADVERTEDALREELARTARGRVQPRAATSTLLAEARQEGFACDPRSLDCAARLGAAIGVSRLIVMEAKNVDAGLMIVLSLTDVEQELLVGHATAPVDAANPDRASLRAALDALQRPTGESASAARAAPEEVARGVPPSLESTQVVAPVVALPAAADAHAPDGGARHGVEAMPVVLTVGGAAVALVSTTAVAAIVLALEQPMEHDARQAVRVTGVTLLVLAASGATIATAGAMMWGT